MTVSGDLRALKRSLKTDIELALAGESPQSVVLLMRQDRLPVAQTTDEHGCVTNKVVSLMDLVSMLDRSMTISQLRRDATRTTDLPPLPPNTLLTSISETPAGNRITVTGYVEPDTYVFVLRHERVTKTFDIPLPHIVYRAVYDEQTSSVSNLSIALCSPGFALEFTSEAPEAPEAPDESAGPAGKPGQPEVSPPGTGTPIFRWMFSNVFSSFGGASEGVCWPGLKDLTMGLSDVPEGAVKRFVRTENNADLYGRGLSHNAPYEDYAELLAAIEREGGIDEDYLIPTGTTVEDLHYQRPPQTGTRLTG